MPLTRKKKQNIEIPPFAKSISPGRDFYEYVNDKWLKHTTMPNYLSSYGISEEIEDLIEPRLQEIISRAQKEVLSTADKQLEKDTILLGTLQLSAIARSSHNPSVKFVKNILLNLRCMRDTNDIAITIGEFIKFRVPCPLEVTIQPSEAHSKELRLCLSPCRLTLPDTSYYTVESRGSAHLLEIYNKMLTEVGNFFEVNNMELFVGIEGIIASALDETKGEEELLMTGRELINKYPHIP